MKIHGIDSCLYSSINFLVGEPFGVNVGILTP